MKWLIHLLICCYLCILSDNLTAQSFPFREYGVLDGLSQSQVTRTIQDSKGFIWISSRNGLSRFDGVEFVNYFRKDGLPSNLVLNIFQDLNRNIWALSKEGLSEYNGFGFNNYSLPPEFEGWSFSPSIAIDSSNNIFILGTGRGDAIRRLIKFKNGVYSNYSAQFPELDTLRISAIYSNPSTSDLILISEQNKFSRWNNNKLYTIPGNNIKEYYFDHEYLLTKSDDNILVYTNKKFESYKLIKTREKSAVNFASALPGQELEFYDGRNTIYIKPPFNYLSYMIDNEGVLWFLSESNLYRLLSTAFSVISVEDIGTRNIWALAEDRNGHLWFGSLYNTLIEYDGKTFRERNEFKTLYRKNLSFYKGSRKMLNGDNWFSTNNGVLIWDGYRFSRLQGIPDDTQICYIYEDPDNQTIMLGTEKGLFIIKNGNIELLPEFNDGNLGVIEGIIKDDAGNYWLSGHLGIIIYNGKKSVAVSEKLLPQGYTYTLVKDSLGGIWVTSEEGLYYREKSSDHFTFGLPELINRSANSIILMDESHILVGRVTDICLIDLKKFYRNEKDYYRIYDNSDGFLGNDCLDNGIIKDHDNKFWILTSNKVVIFDPQKIKINTYPPRVHIIGFDYQTDSLSWQPIDKSNYFYSIPENIKLKSYQNKIQIRFTAISTTNPEKVMLQYRLQGYEDKWSLPATKRFVVYEQLPPGHYRFEVKAFNADGVETLNPLTLNFRVMPSFWQTKIFAAIAFIIIILLTVALTRYIIKSRQRKHEESYFLRSELSRLQMSSVLKQFDPHFTFNVISSVGSLIMRGDKETAYNYITKLSSLLRTVLSDGSIIIRPLSEEIEFVRQYCELQKLRFKDRFKFRIIIDIDTNLQRDIPKMTIQTFVENAIKHGFENRKEGGMVEVFVKNSEDYLEIRIVDNGIGRAAAARQQTGGTGYGLKIIQGLFEVMNKNNLNFSTVTISDREEDCNVIGTDVRILIPEDYRFEFANVRAR